MVVGLLGNKSPDSNRFTLVTPKSENDARLQAKLGNQNPTGLPVGAVRLDYDLAELYGYEVKRLNEQVKRNIARFPEDFMFQLTTEEDGFLKSQFATSSWGGKRKLPYAFTEQGICMLATVLRGELAEQQSIFIMRAFREMRHYIKQNQQFVTQSEMHLVSARVSEISVQMSNMADRQKKTEQDIQVIQKSIDTLNVSTTAN